jgi:hypothetical protein
MIKKLIGIFICVLLITVIFPVVSSIDTEYIDNLSSEVNIDKGCGCDTYYDTKDEIYLNPYPDSPVMKNPPDIIGKHSIPVKPELVYTPDEFSWRDYDGKDWTTIATNQGYCGSCWAFAALGSLESIINIREDCAELDPDLSEQYVLSCLPESGSCWGGSTGDAFHLIMDTSAEGNYCNGIIPESCFPYRGIDAKGRDYDGYNHDPVLCSEKCENWEDSLIPISDYGHLDLGGTHQEDIEMIKSQVFQNGPVAAGIYVIENFYKFWRESTDPDDYYPYKYSGGRINHVVVIVGWKDDPLIGKGGYWICKNSWGLLWGHDGFFNIEYGSLNIDKYIIWADYDPSDFDWAPIVDTGGPYGAYVDQECVFDGSKSFGVEGAIVEYYWDFGDGTYDTEPITTHTYPEVGVFDVSLTVTDSEGNSATENTNVWVQVTNDCPNIPIINGKTSLKQYSIGTYTVNSTDPDGNDLYYYIDWGDGQAEEWIGPYASGVDAEIKHKWANLGTITIKAKSKDVFDEEGDWGTFEVTIPRNKLVYNAVPRFLQQLPNAFPILRHILGLL